MTSTIGRAESYWMVGGAIVLFLLSGLTLFGLLPGPFYLVIAFFLAGMYGALLMPALYLLVTFFDLRRTNSGVSIFRAALMFGALNILYSLGAWENGVRWQGKGVTLLVIGASVFGFIVTAVLAYRATRRKSVHLLCASYFTLFLVMSLFAFPLFGEGLF